LAIVALLAAGCGDDGGDEDDAATGDTEASADSTTTTAAGEPATTTTEAAAPGYGEAECSDSTPDCSGTITPFEGLTDGQEVTIEVSGFEPGTTLGITQCVSELDPDNGVETTGAEHCNLRGIGNTAADDTGSVSATFNVAAGATMEANTEAGVTCDAEHDCVVSVGELVPDPDAQRVTFQLSFA